MTRLPLPLLDPARIEFGFTRTVCACHACTRYCHHLPGYLIPADLERIHQQLSPGEDLDSWARQHLLASPGALVLRRGRVARIPTLVPAHRPDGACLFLTAAEQCAIHAIAPYGCAFFDDHMRSDEADRRSQLGLQAILAAWQANDSYAQLWMSLVDAARVAPAPEIGRKQLAPAKAVKCLGESEKPVNDIPR